MQTWLAVAADVHGVVDADADADDAVCTTVCSVRITTTNTEPDKLHLYVQATPATRRSWGNRVGQLGCELVCVLHV